MYRLPEMVVVKAATFKMGSPDVDHHKDEYPPHDVSIAQFAMSQFELTFDRVGRVLAHGDCRGNISAEWGRGSAARHQRDLAGCQELRGMAVERTGKPYRLLTEAEWEYAAGTGKTTLYFFGNDDAMLDQYSWYGMNAQNQAHAVGTTKKANPFRLSDMYGNVAEWVEDCYHEGYRGAPTDGSAWTTSAIVHIVSFEGAIGCRGLRVCARLVATGDTSIKAQTVLDCGSRVRSHVDAKPRGTHKGAAL